MNEIIKEMRELAAFLRTTKAEDIADTVENWIAKLTDAEPLAPSALAEDGWQEHVYRAWKGVICVTHLTHPRLAIQYQPDHKRLVATSPTIEQPTARQLLFLCAAFDKY